MNINEFEFIKDINNIDSREEMWNKIIEISSIYENKLDKIYRRSQGIYYTNIELAKYIIDEMFKISNKSKKEIIDKVLLEPCVGIGSFIYAYFKKIFELGYSKNEVESILQNVYIADIDKTALKLFKAIFTRFIFIYFDIELFDSYFEGRVGSTLVFDIEKGSEYIPIEDVFPDVMKNGGFDVIITNPPYKNLKAEKNKYLKDEEVKKIQESYKKFSKFVKQQFNYANEGVLNLYKVFIEEIVCNYSKKDAEIVLLVPSTILTDKTCEKLRTMILENHSIKTINLIPENNKYLDAKQALCTLLIKKGEKTDKIKIINELNLDKKVMHNIINYEDIKNPYTGNSIFAVSQSEQEILRKLRENPVIKELNFIKNLRGELDVTANKEFILSNVTDYKLIRGRDISYYKLNSKEIMEFVSDEFIKNSTKAKYINEDRIVCQQVVNIHKERRLTFALCKKGNVVANSCNFLYVEQNEFEIDIYILMGLMNSSLMNWLFKLTSSNNHVNNYEIDALPIPVKSPYLKEIGKTVLRMLNKKEDFLIEKIDKLVYKAFDINIGEGIENEEEKINIKDETKAVDTKNVLDENFIINNLYKDIRYIIKNSNFTLKECKDIFYNKLTIESYIHSSGIKLNKDDVDIINGIIKKYSYIASNKILNHTTFKLSDLDLEMIKNVPQGGNWKNIPREVVNKSQRLVKITKSGGRTTLYGRIDYSKPCYTITTYFNRPGNGTYVHPEQERVISVREAARIQSFRDDYIFVGNKSELLKQVGNAVPPILAYEIAKSIRKKVRCETSVDLFVGAGGMSVGFKEAGIKAIVANDFEKSACKTFKINNPEVEVVHGDITDLSIKEKIYEYTVDKDVDLVCGGPPCQGFSHAGKRFIDDPRNQLFKDFIEVVEKIKPKVVVMENVEGMLTFMKGEIYNQIIELYNKIGYKACGKIMLASEYGVPQKRKRVIIICTRKDLNVFPEELFPNKTTEKIELQITAKDAIYDLASSACSEDATYCNTDLDNISEYAKKMREYKVKDNNITLLEVATTSESDGALDIPIQLRLF